MPPKADAGTGTKKGKTKKNEEQKPKPDNKPNTRKNAAEAVTQGTNMQLCGTLMPKQYDVSLPEIVPTTVDYSLWTPQHLDLWYEIPEEFRKSKDSRVKYLNDWRARETNMGFAHDIAMTVATNVGKVVLNQAKAETSRLRHGFETVQTEILEVKEQANVAFVAAKNDGKSSQEVLLRHPKMLEELAPIIQTDPETCRKKAYEFLKPFCKEFEDWQDVEEVRTISAGPRRRLVIQLLSNHQRQRVMKNWYIRGEETLTLLGYTEEEQDEIEMEPSKTAYKQWVDRKIYNIHKQCHISNLNSNGDKFYIVEKAPGSGKFKRITEYLLSSNLDNPEVVKLKEEWDQRKNAKKEEIKAAKLAKGSSPQETSTTPTD